MPGRTARTNGNGTAAREEVLAMIMRYLRYTLAALTTVAFGLTVN